MGGSNFAHLTPDAVFHGRYRIVRRLKAGGMGAVYEIVDERVAARRALKVMLPDALEDPDLRARFENEPKLAGSIESDHIVHVSDAGIDDDTGMPFLVMDLLEGEDLASLLRQRGPLPADEVVTYLAQAARGLDKAHAKAIVHRDLKPENLFVTTRDDGAPCVKILDFGIAKVTGEGHDNTTKAIGTPKYMSPEQVRGKGISPRSDVFAIAQVAYTLLVGEPYLAQEAAEDFGLGLLLKIVSGFDEPPVARALRRRGVGLPPGFDAWFQKATALKPEERFDRASAAVDALAAALSVSPVASAPGTAIAPAPSSRSAGTVSSSAATPMTSGGGGTDTTGGKPVTTAPPPSAPPNRSRAIAGAAVIGVIVVAGVLWKLVGSGTSAPDPRPSSTTAKPPDVPAAASAQPAEAVVTPASALPVPSSLPSASAAASASTGPRRAPPPRRPDVGHAPASAATRPRPPQLPSSPE